MLVTYVYICICLPVQEVFAQITRFEREQADDAAAAEGEEPGRARSEAQGVHYFLERPGPLRDPLVEGHETERHTMIHRRLRDRLIERDYERGHIF